MVATNYEQLITDLAKILSIEKYLDKVLPELAKEGIVIPEQNKKSYYLKACWIISRLNGTKIYGQVREEIKESYDYLVKNFHLLQEYKR